MVKKNDHGISIAGSVASKWSDEALMSKTVDDIVKAFGISARSAESVLRSERMNRGMK